MAEPLLRLLFDENLAAWLVRALADLYPTSLHVADVRLLSASDLAIWQYARENELVLVSKDEDFQRLSVLLGPPPKVIWVRLGNCSTENVSQLLRRRRHEIEEFVRDSEAGFLALA